MSAAPWQEIEAAREKDFWKLGAAGLRSRAERACQEARLDDQVGDFASLKGEWKSRQLTTWCAASCCRAGLLQRLPAHAFPTVSAPLTACHRSDDRIVKEMPRLARPWHAEDMIDNIVYSTTCMVKNEVQKAKDTEAKLNREREAGQHAFRRAREEALCDLGAEVYNLYTTRGVHDSQEQLLRIIDEEAYGHV